MRSNSVGRNLTGGSKGDQMLRVISIIEGGIDLEKGKEIPRSMVVTNGTKVVTVPVPDHVVDELVGLFASELEKVVEPAPRKMDRPKPANHIVVKEITVAETSKPVSAGMPKPRFEVQPLFEEPEAPSSTDLDESGFEPGEEYDDSGTGVSSL